MEGPRHRYVPLPSVLTIVLLTAGSALIGAAPAYAAAQATAPICVGDRIGG